MVNTDQRTKDGAGASRFSPPTPTGPEENPFGLGDPSDRTLRKVEKEILVPKKMREKARLEKCTEQVAAFTECCKNAPLFNLAMVVTCRAQNAKLKECLTDWYQNPTFRQECEDEYLKERTEFRSSGIRQKQRRHESTGMH